jgi:Domain of unknown function (DUF4260)
MAATLRHWLWRTYWRRSPGRDSGARTRLKAPSSGAHLYNLTHATLLPAVMPGAGYRQADRLVMALALVWLAHIGLDRLLGMGLKYNDRFTHTHLGDRPDAR